MRLSFDEIALLVLVAQRAPDSINANLGRKLARAYADLKPCEPVTAEFFVTDRYGIRRPASVATRKAKIDPAQDEDYGRLSLTAFETDVLTEALYASKVKAYTPTQLGMLSYLLATLEAGRVKVTLAEEADKLCSACQILLPASAFYVCVSKGQAKRSKRCKRCLLASNKRCREIRLQKSLTPAKSTLYSTSHQPMPSELVLSFRVSARELKAAYRALSKC